MSSQISQRRQKKKAKKSKHNPELKINSNLILQKGGLGIDSLEHLVTLIKTEYVFN